jgi:hypothetical protein
MESIFELIPKEANPFLSMFIFFGNMGIFILLMLITNQLLSRILMILTLITFVLVCKGTYDDTLGYSKKIKTWEEHVLKPYLQKETKKEKTKEIDHFFIKKFTNKKSEVVVFFKGEKSPRLIESKIELKDKAKALLKYNTLDPYIRYYFGKYYKEPVLTVDSIKKENLVGFSENIKFEEKVRNKRYEDMRTRQATESAGIVIWILLFTLNIVAINVNINKRRTIARISEDGGAKDEFELPETQVVKFEEEDAEIILKSAKKKRIIRNV